MRGALPFLLVLLSGCGARTIGSDYEAPVPSDDAGSPAFPSGTWKDCAEGLYNANGNLFLNSTGFVADATLALTQNGSDVTATYDGASGVANSLQFAPTTNASASLTPAGQAASGFSGLCVQGIGMQNEHFYPAEVTANAGTLTYDAGVVFVTLAGTLAGDGGACGWQSVPASWWILCQDGPTHEPIAPLPPSPIPELPAGSFSCRSQVATFYQSDGLDQYVSSGGDGILQLTQASTELIANYDGDPTITGTLHLNLTTSATATAPVGQSLTAPCEVPIGMGSSPPPTPEMLPITAGSLSVVDSTLIVSFAGTLGGSSSCPGARKAGSVICSLP